MSYTPAAQVSWLEPKANPLLGFGTLAAREMYDGHAAVSNALVRKYMVIIGGSHGAGIYGMRARAYGPMQPCMWPKSRISVMGAD